MNFLIFICVILFLIYMSGRRKRSYNVLSYDEVIYFKDDKIKVEDIAKEYQPILYQLKSLRGYEPEKTLYEIIEKTEKIIINYYNFWKNEIHPNLIIHYLYSFFRFIYYGSCADIEFVQVVINRRTGEILEVNAESDSHNNPDTFFSDHIKFKIKQKENNVYELFLDNKFIKNVFLPKDGNRMKILVITWNHVYGFYEGQESYEFKEIPLVYLTEKLYAKYRMKRRSKGEQ